MSNSPFGHHLLHMLLKEAPDVAGEWLAICPRIGMVTQGTAPIGAFTMGMDAIRILWTTDILEGRNPFDREDPDDEHTGEINALLDDSEMKRGSVETMLAESENLRAVVVEVIVWAQEQRLPLPNAVGSTGTDLFAMAS